MSRRATRPALVVERGALLVVTFFFLAPVVWLITTAYKPSVDIFSYPPTLAFVPTLENFRAPCGISILATCSKAA